MDVLVSKQISIEQSDYNDTTLLPVDYALSDKDVLCGRGQRCVQHVGNQRFRKIVQCSLSKYAEATSKGKSLIIRDIINQIRHTNKTSGGFVKYEPLTRRYYQVGDALAREKTSQALRDELEGLYKSSSASKKRRRTKEPIRSLKRQCSDSLCYMAGSSRSTKRSPPAFLQRMHCNALSHDGIGNIRAEAQPSSSNQSAFINAQPQMGMQVEAKITRSCSINSMLKADMHSRIQLPKSPKTNVREDNFIQNLGYTTSSLKQHQVVHPSPLTLPRNSMETVQKAGEKISLGNALACFKPYHHPLKSVTSSCPSQVETTLVRPSDGPQQHQGEHGRHLHLTGILRPREVDYSSHHNEIFQQLLQFLDERDYNDNDDPFEPNPI